MRWLYSLTVLVAVGSVNADEGFTNRQGTHTLTLKGREVYHSLANSAPSPVNDETARAWNGNRVRDVVAVSGTAFADLDDIHVVAVDRDGKVWHTARLPDGTWLRWGSVQDEVGDLGAIARVRCSSEGRTLLLTVVGAAGRETRCVRTAEGRWSVSRP